MTWTTEGISNVRVRPLAAGPADGQGGGAAPAAAGTLEVTWTSTHPDRWHQVYVDGRLAAVTARPEDRRLVVSAPPGRGGTPTRVQVEVVAVDAADRWTDFGAALPGTPAEEGLRVRLTWQAGTFLDPNLEAFDVFGDGGTGAIDYAAPLNESPIPARPGGQTPWGYGTGGYGVGGWGQSAAVFTWTSDPLALPPEGPAPGTYRFAVVAVDAAGNRSATAAEVQVTLSPPPRPPENLRLADYDPATRTAHLAWDPSPDLG